MAEVVVAISCSTIFIGMVAMAVKVSMTTRNQRNDQMQAIAEAREAVETVERLLNRAVEVREWDPNTPWWVPGGIPSLSDATGEPGETYNVSASGVQPFVNGGAPVQQDDVISHDGVRWRIQQRVVGTWNGLTAGWSPPGGPSVGDTISVSTTSLPPWNSNAPAPVSPPGGWINGDRVTWNGASWLQSSWRAPTNFPLLSDGGGAVGSLYYVSQAGTVNLGSGSLTFSVGDFIVKGAATWRNGCKTSLRNFKSTNPLSNADDNVNGIQFYADVDPDNAAGDFYWSGVGFNQVKRLEWVWIWWDSAIDVDQTNRAYERRGPLKVAIFRADPYGAGTDTHDFWTRPTHTFFQTINNPPTTARKYYHTAAANFGNLEFKVQEFLVPTSSGPVVKKRVAMTGGVFLDRTKELAGLPNPWLEVAPGSRAFSARGGRWMTTPSYTFSRSIYPKNLNATTDPLGRPFGFQNTTNRYNRVRRQAVGWTTQFNTGSIKSDHVVQPR